MKITGAIIKEQGLTFAIVLVKSSVLRSPDKEQIRQSFTYAFGNIPIVLVAQDSQGIPTYDGRKDIVKALTPIHPSRIPWRNFEIS